MSPKNRFQSSSLPPRLRPRLLPRDGGAACGRPLWGLGAPPLFSAGLAQDASCAGNVVPSFRERSAREREERGQTGVAPRHCDVHGLKDLGTQTRHGKVKSNRNSTLQPQAMVLLKA